MASGVPWEGPSTSATPNLAGFFEMKMKYDESDNVLIRASRALTDKVTDVLGEHHSGWVSTTPGAPPLLAVALGGHPGPGLTRPWSIGGLFSKTEMSEVLTEILRVDPAFDKDRFLKQCESDIIPNVLEVPAAPCSPLSQSTPGVSGCRDVS